MTSIFGKGRTRLAITTIAILLIGAALVYASTTVTVTKTSQYRAYTSFYTIDGNVRTTVSVNLTEMGDTWMLYYSAYSYEYDPTTPPYVTYTYQESGNGEIDADDVVASASGVYLYTDTTDIATLGDGGILELEWTPADGLTYETSSKSTTKTDTYKSINFGGTSYSQATVEGSVFDEDYVSTGSLLEQKGKTIYQLFD